MSRPSEGKSADVARNAFSVDMKTSTPLAKHFLGALFTTDFYSRENFTISVRQPRRA